MRGALRRRDDGRKARGIIPAYAGSTPRTLSGWTRTRDHPRVCGEHESNSVNGSGEVGSSPRMRGAPLRTASNVCDMRIIPAYAGSTRPLLGGARAWQDHPRVCGEHYSTALTKIKEVGSSPRMRGAPKKLVRRMMCLGIIPAYAGSTSVGFVHICVDWDHPRVCGEHA